MALRKTITIFAALLLSLFLGSVQAADYKIGYVNGQLLISKSPEAIALPKKLEKEFNSRRQKLIAQGKQLQKLKEKGQKDALTMSKSELSRLEADVRARDREFNNDKKALFEDINIRKNQELVKIRNHIKELVNSVAKENNFDLVLEGAGVVYYSKRADITDLVLKRMKSAK